MCGRRSVWKLTVDVRVDDHDGFRDAARLLLEADGYDVVGTAADGEAR